MIVATTAVIPVAEEPFDLQVPQPNCFPRAPKRGRLIKEHACAVTYPDGAGGKARYQRFGPAYHAFDYTHCPHGTEPGTPEHAEKPGRRLAHLYSCQRLDNTVEAIEAKCRELSESAFWRAVEEERRDWFARATLPDWRRREVDPAATQMCLRRARALGGKYALCVPLGPSRFVPADGPVFDTLKEACEAWRKGDRNPGRRLVVCCCSRLDRNWQLPRLNPLVAEGHPRRPE